MGMPMKPFQRIAAGIKARGSKGALHQAMGVPMGQRIPDDRLNSLRLRLRKIKKRTPAQSRRLKQVNLAETFRGGN